MVHLTQGSASGGTAFYRQRATRYGAITPDRIATYQASVALVEAASDPAAAGYYQGDGDRNELIGEIEARPDRVIAYRSGSYTRA